jgi:hypothetical protein
MMMNGVEVIAKQEDYRKQTISIVAGMIQSGDLKESIAEAVGISKEEVDAIERIVKIKVKAGRASESSTPFLI